MLEIGKRYRIKGTELEFGYAEVDGIYMGRYKSDINIWRVANALATNDYEEVKKKVKKTYYQGICAEPTGTGEWFCTNWRTSHSRVVAEWLEKFGRKIELTEIIEREFEV